jgi:hypothetical protein
MSLARQIEKTEDLIEDYSMMPHDNSEEDLNLENQLAIMKALEEIQEDLSRVKKSYPGVGFGPG